MSKGVDCPYSVMEKQAKRQILSILLPNTSPPQESMQCGPLSSSSGGWNMQEIILFGSAVEEQKEANQPHQHIAFPRIRSSKTQPLE